MDICQRVAATFSERSTTDIILAYVYLFMSVAGCICNMLSLFCLFKIKRKQQTVKSDTILVGLIISDLINSAFFMSYQFVMHLYASTVLKLCLLQKVFNYYLGGLTLWSSSAMISFIAINRYIKLTKMSNYHNILSERRIASLVVGIYTFCVFVPVVVFFRLLIVILINFFVMWGTTCVLVVFYVLIRRAMKRSQQSVQASGGRVSNLHPISFQLRNTFGNVNVFIFGLIFYDIYVTVDLVRVTTVK